MGSLRGRLHDLPREREIVTVCSQGLRSYEAAVALRHAGFERVRMLDGGLESWPWDLERM